ncbi:MAG: MFS transporter, partial [Kordiimonas sp.]
MKQKPQLSFWQIWNMCFGFLGIQFGFALQNSNISRIFQSLGAEIDEIPILFVAAPLTGLLVQPIVGYMSDRTWNSFGRRRPFFFAGALLAAITLLYMPNSPYLWIAAGTLWIMDASINIAMEPFRAFVGDMLPEKQRPLGYTMQSFFIGVGSVAASALPWMMTNWWDVSNTAEVGGIPDSVAYAFYAGGIVLFLSVMWTVFSTKEYSPQQIKAFEAAEKSNRPVDRERAVRRSSGKYRKGAVLWGVLGVIFTAAIYLEGWEAELYMLSIGGIVFALMQFIAGVLQDNARTENGFYRIIDDLFHMPKGMKQLIPVQFFAWFALFSMWIYTTPAVTGFHYGSSDPSSVAYNEGANWVGVLFAAYNLFAALAA